MQRTTRMTKGRTLAGGVVLGATILGSTGIVMPATHAAAAKAATMPTWVTTQAKVVHLTLIAGYDNTNSGFNFGGTYLLICGIAGHAIAGMWDTFVVSAPAKTALVTFK